MKKEDLKEIAEHVTTVVDQRFGQFKEEITDEFSHQRGMLLDNFQHKLDIVVEGHQMLDEKIDRLDERVDGMDAKINRLDERVGGMDAKIDRLDERLVRVEKKVDGVAEDLAEHRRDTEAHKSGYKAMDE